MSELHALDKRVASIEEFRERVETIELPAIREAVRNEIPRHYSKKIRESETNTMLRIEKLIDDRLKARFGWVSRIIEGIVLAALIALTLKGLGLAG